MAEEDLLFGKNRHMFGGIEPSNMAKFEAKIKNDSVEITATLPGNTVVNGQTLCTVAGAVIRRKENEYPTNEFDGDFVADINGSTVVNDSNVDVNKTYCYSAFPYTTQGVYNRSVINRSGINMPATVSKFSGKSIYDYQTDSGSIELTVELPEGVSGAVIRKSETRYPETETEGDVVTTITTGGVYTDENVSVGNRYYYSIFTYLDNGAYCRDLATSINVACVKYQYLYGFDLDTNNPDPTERVTYPTDVDNAGFKPVQMNYDISKFDYGDWPSEVGKDFMPRPCMLLYDGTVHHYLDPNNYSKREDGVTDSKVADLDFEGQAMMEWPKIYTYREETEEGIYKFRCSDTPQGEGWDCWCNYDDYDNQIDHFYTSIYACGLDDGTTDIQTDVANHMTLRSMSGIDIATAEYFTRYRSAANRRDATKSTVYGMWGIELLADHLLIQDLLVMLGKSTDCQAVFGNGVGESSYYRIDVNGTLNDKGLFWGSNDYKSGLKIFGMENYWGNNRRYIDGWMMRNGAQYVKITRGEHDGTTLRLLGSTRGENVYYSFGAEYEYCLKVLSSSPSGTSGGYISDMLVKSYGRIPKAVLGSSTTYEPDTFSWTTDPKLTMYIGGNTSSTLRNGPFRADTSGVSSGQSSTCVGLSCKPNAVTE